MQLSTQEPAQSSTVTQFLKFNLLTDITALLPIAQLAAVLNIETTQITAIPHLPPWIMGVCNWRGEVLWIVDTGHLLGARAWQQQTMGLTRYTILLLEQSLPETTERRRLGLLVGQVEGIEWLSLDDIQSPLLISEALVPFLRGYWLTSTGTMLTLLDGPAIFDRMPRS